MFSGRNKYAESELLLHLHDENGEEQKNGMGANIEFEAVFTATKNNFFH